MKNIKLINEIIGSKINSFEDLLTHFFYTPFHIYYPDKFFKILKLLKSEAKLRASFFLNRNLNDIDMETFVELLNSSTLSYNQTVTLVILHTITSDTWLDNIQYFILYLILKYESLSENSLELLKSVVYWQLRGLHLENNQSQIKMFEDNLDEIVTKSAWNSIIKSLENLLSTEIDLKLNLDPVKGLEFIQRTNTKFTFYSKIPLRHYIYLLIQLNPDVIEPLINIVTYNSMKYTDLYRNWIITLLDVYSELLLNEKIDKLSVELLDQFTHYSQSTVRLPAIIAYWLTTGNKLILKKGLNDPSIRVRNRIEKIMDNLDKEKTRIINKYKKYETSLSKFKELSLKSKFFEEYSSKDNYIIKINYGRVSRTYAFSGDSKLIDIHYTIQNDFGWDDDHLHAFYMAKKPYGRSPAFYCPNSEENPNTNQVSIHELKLRKNQVFTYLFDFGDNHTFTLQVEDIKNEKEIQGPFPKLISKGGKAPKQYYFSDEI